MSRRGPARLAQLTLALFLLCTGFGASRAQDAVAVSAFLDPASGYTETEPIRLVIRVQGLANPRVNPPRMPNLSNLAVIAGPNTKSSFSWINGRSSSTLELIYTLLAERPGPAAIPPLQLEVDGKRYTTPPFQFDVAKSQGGPPQTPAQTRAPGGQAQAAEGLFLQADLGADEVWVGQSVPLTVTLLSQPRVTGFAWRQQPDFANFWVETTELDSDAEAYRTTVGGQAYLAYPVDRRVLIPPGPGVFELEPYIAEVQVRLARQDALDWFRFGRSESVLRKSAPKTLRVKQLPRAGRPDNFNGAVGKYTFKAALDRTEARVDDAVALRATVQGEGALRSVGPPVIESPADLKVFDPQVKESTVRTVDGKIVSKKTWEWIIVPLTPGDIRLPELSFDYFNPYTSRYERAANEPLILTVERGDARADTPSARGDIRRLRTELAFIKPLSGALRTEHPRAHERLLFRALTTLPLALVPVLIVLGRQRARLQNDHGLARGKRARARARKRLQLARKRLEQVGSEVFHQEVARTLVDYLADRTNRSAAGLTYEAADKLLADKDVEPLLRGRFRACLEACDFVRFVPEASQTGRRVEILDEASDILEQLDRAW